VETVAHGLLAPIGDQWRHTRGVVARASDLARAVTVEDRALLIAAAWLHDIGYAPALRRTGMHQLDGAEHLLDAGCSERLCALVAHHSAATFEAEERGLLAELNRLPCEQSPVADALWAADMTTAAMGEPVDFPTRLEEIMNRHGHESLVARAAQKARPAIEAAICRTYARLAQ
jgi:hypothetical protein